MLALGYIPIENFKHLSFIQIRQFKKDYPELFEKYLAAQNFSELQCLFWNKLNKILNATAEKLEVTLSNSRNQAVLAQEPYFLETLVQELSPLQLTKKVKQVLSIEMRALDTRLESLPSKTIMKTIELISHKKCSLEAALRAHKVSLAADDKKVKLHFVDIHQKPHSLLISKTLLTKARRVFQAMLNKYNSKEHSCQEVDLAHVDLEAFKQFLGYLQTGELQTCESSLNSVLQIADQYEFLLLKTNLEKHLCRHLNQTLKTMSLTTLLEFCMDYGMQNLKKAVDLKLSHTLRMAQEDFIVQNYREKLSLAQEFQLVKTREILLEIFLQELHKDTLDKRVFICLLIDFAEVNPNPALLTLRHALPYSKSTPIYLKYCGKRLY